MKTDKTAENIEVLTYEIEMIIGKRKYIESLPAYDQADYPHDERYGGDDKILKILEDIRGLL